MLQENIRNDPIYIVKTTSAFQFNFKFALAYAARRRTLVKDKLSLLRFADSFALPKKAVPLSAVP